MIDTELAATPRAASRHRDPDTMRGIDGMHRLAAAVLDEHVERDGRCAACGSAFPCRLAVLAEHTAAL